MVLIERDGLEDAEELLADLGDPPATTAVPFLGFQAARGRLRAAQGRLEEGLADLLACGEHAQRIGVIGGDRNWRSHAALIDYALGNTDHARGLAAEDVALAHEFGRPRAIGIALHAHGMVSDGEQRLVSLSGSVEALQRSPARLELARAKADYGGALRRAGQRIRAREQLEQALDTAHHCGARRIVAATRAELIMLGAKPRRDAITGRDALTPSELRVARLAPQGLANSEIAQALFITRKTASVHLTRVYRKLGITHRRELAQALAETPRS
jgi:DNA-binding CsgD family transcriptional regulator